MQGRCVAGAVRCMGQQGAARELPLPPRLGLPRRGTLSQPASPPALLHPPDFLCLMISEGPPWLVAKVGSPHVMASITVRPKAAHGRGRGVWYGQRMVWCGRAEAQASRQRRALCMKPQPAPPAVHATPPPRTLVQGGLRKGAPRVGDVSVQLAVAHPVLLRQGQGRQGGRARSELRASGRRSPAQPLCAHPPRTPHPPACLRDDPAEAVLQAVLLHDAVHLAALIRLLAVHGCLWVNHAACGWGGGGEWWG